MNYYAGIDVAMERSALCVVDETGSIVLERSIDTEPDEIAETLAPFAKTLRRVGHETGSLAPWLHKELRARGLPVICMEAAHTRSALKAQRNKTDRNDARGLAQILRTGWFRPVHIKSDESYRMRLLLTARRNMKRKFLDIENAIRHSLKAFGIRLGQVSRARFEAKVRAALADDVVLTGMVEGLLKVRSVLWVEYCALHKLLVKIVGRDPVCRRFLAVPGVGPVTALSFRASVDDPHRFAKSRTVGAHFGLTPRRWQSGTSVDQNGHISKKGDGEVRWVLYESANALLTLMRRPDPLKSWGRRIAKKRGHKAACVAVARKLAVIMHAMWRDGTDYGDPKSRDNLSIPARAIAAMNR
ncbi:IS110 family transposase [Hoeflea sp.]|uniref:IS110 family transposase n=1 Tax=Hoeflea sp. TaxID=1940281 RepID=UPI003B018A09